MYSEDVLEEVKNRADIIEVISEYTSLKRRGGSYIGLCPFHSENTPSFNVNVDKQLFYCFGCGEGGNIFTFLMKKEHLSFPEAVNWLAERYNISLPAYKKDQGLSNEYKERQELFQVNEWVSKLFHYNLLNTREGEGALKYLKDRGIDDDTIKGFTLGYADKSWDGLKNHALRRNISQATLLKLGLISQRRDGRGYYDRFRGRIMFPIYDNTNKVVAFGGRALEDRGPKYLNSPETPIFTKGDHLYALPKIPRNSDQDVIVVEGYMDCIALHQNNFNHSVATLGTAFTQRQAKLLKRSSDGVILAFDADAAGQRATLKSIDLLYKEGFIPKVLSLPAGKDPDDFIRLHGAKAFQEQLLKAQDHVRYKWALLQKGLDLNTPNGKIRFFKSSVKVLSKIPKGPEQEIYIRDLADQLDVPTNSIRQELYQGQLPTNGLRYKKSHTRDNNREIPKRKPLTRFLQAEEQLLKAIIEEDWVLQKYGDDISVDIFLDSNTRKIADLVLNYDRQKKIDISDLFNHLDEEARDVLSRIIVTKTSTQEEYVKELINNVKISFLKDFTDKIREKLKEAELVGDREEINELLKTYQKLKSDMDRLRRMITPGKGGA